MNSSDLQPNRFQALSLNEIRPTGWLKQQLKLQASSLSGTLDEWWPSVRDSQWFGGDNDGWERGPYWLDGFIPMAYLLDDASLISKANNRIQQCLSLRGADGWIGPGKEDSKYDLWGHVPLLKGIMQLHDLNGDSQLLNALHQQLLLFHRLIEMRPLSNWANFRWFEYLIPAFYVFERTGDTRILDFCHKCYHQGFSWRSWFLNGGNQSRSGQQQWSFISHVVNNTMAIKEGALWYRISKDSKDLDDMMTMIQLLDQYHGQVHGAPSGDECLAGKDPIQGTELCSIVEAMYSLEHAILATGDTALADKLERITFNALPATFSEDMWTHQYDQQVNQIECSDLEYRKSHLWTTNGSDSNLFGIEPHFGCCTANLSQGWPKFIAHAWMKNSQGLVAISYAPTVVNTNIKGVPVTVECESEYPFRDEIKIRVKPSRPLRFSLQLRIPQWCLKAQVHVQGECHQPNSGWHLVDTTWEGEETVVLKLPMDAKVEEGWMQSRTVTRGPLVYTVAIESEKRKVESCNGLGMEERRDTELLPKSPWNVAIPLENSILDSQLNFIEKPLKEHVFNETNPPVECTLKGRVIKNWSMKGGSHDQMPHSPVAPSQLDQEVDLRLIPYGCSKLRLTEIPSYDKATFRAETGLVETSEQE